MNTAPRHGPSSQLEKLLAGCVLWLVTAAAQAQLQLAPIPPLLGVPVQALAPALAVVRPIQRDEGEAAQILQGVGGALVFEGVDRGDGQPLTEAAAAPDPGGPDYLEFANGEHLHGSLESLDSARQELGWRRTDITQALDFPIPQVTRVVFPGGLKTPPKAHATVKLRRGGWFAAELAGFRDGVCEFHPPDGGAPWWVNRKLIEWIAFSEGPAPECYEGPTGLGGWLSSGPWVFRDGALRLYLSPAPIGRYFEALPDLVEYALTVEQDVGENAFGILLHSRNLLARGFTSGSVQLIVQGETLRIWAQTGDNMKVEQTDIGDALRPAGRLGASPKRDTRAPIRLRIFEDFPHGKITVMINGRQAAAWEVVPGKPGANRGGFSFQPMLWSPETEVAISKISVEPWNGRLPTEDAVKPPKLTQDQVCLAGGEIRGGILESISPTQVALQVPGGAEAEFARNKVAMLRLREEEGDSDDSPAIARLRLTGRGELQARALLLREGRLRLLTDFGPIALPPSAVREVEFLGMPWAPPASSDALVFRSGDRLRGWLAAAGDGPSLRWQLARTGEPLTVSVANAVGALFSRSQTAAPLKAQAVARFRNGDWLAGDFLTLDAQHVVLEAPFSSQLVLPREGVKAVYFPADGETPILDGSSKPEAWTRSAGLVRPAPLPLRRSSFTPLPPPAPSPWIYFDGAYTLNPKLAAPDNTGAGPSLGRLFRGMPQSAEFSFEIAIGRSPLFVTVQAFSDADNPGYMVQIYPDGLNIYDLAPRLRGAAVNPLQVQFTGKIKRTNRHRVRLLADRPSGRLAVILDDVLLAQYPQKAAATPRNLGCGLQVASQPGAPCTLVNLWIGPWDGLLPGKAPPDEVETVLLGNGDEAQGKISRATPARIRLDAEIGPLEIPVERLLTVDFGGEIVPSPPGPRIRLGSQGTLSLRSFRVADGAIVCQTISAGELRIPLEAVRELAFGSATAEAEPPPDTRRR